MSLKPAELFIDCRNPQFSSTSNKVTSKAIWSVSPFFRILLPFINGILVETFFPVPFNFLITGLCLSLFLVLYSICFPQISPKGWIYGFAIQTIVFSFGGILLKTQKDSPFENRENSFKKSSNSMVMQLIGDPVPKQNSLKCIARVIWLIKDHSCFYENEKVLVYFSRSVTDPLSYGTTILFRKELRPIENSGRSPFDYKKYCRLRHIYGQVFLKENEFSLVASEKGNRFSTMLTSVRKKILIIIKKQIPSASENGLLEALMVGYTDDLDQGLLKSYADSGVIHIIAISGLHLALICHILQLVLKRTGQKKAGRWIKLAWIISVLWGYSLLSGASPSVIRSAMMFSLVLFGRNIFREAVLYNTLAASAFLLLCFDANWIWDTGFQLSYAAVLSLRLFSKPVRDLIPLQNKFLSAIWDAGSVSIAAQILTTPISIFYFHRFPSYFLVANLLAVPLSSGILVGGILLASFAWIPILAQSLGWLLGNGIQLLNGYVQWISRLPGSVIAPLSLSLPQLILAYGIIFCFYHFLRRKEKLWLFATLCTICFFQLCYYLI